MKRNHHILFLLFSFVCSFAFAGENKWEPGITGFILHNNVFTNPSQDAPDVLSQRDISSYKAFPAWGAGCSVSSEKIFRSGIAMDAGIGFSFRQIIDKGSFKNGFSPYAERIEQHKMISIPFMIGYSYKRFSLLPGIWIGVCDIDWVRRTDFNGKSVIESNNKFVYPQIFFPSAELRYQVFKLNAAVILGCDLFYDETNFVRIGFRYRLKTN